MYQVMTCVSQKARQQLSPSLGLVAKSKRFDVFTEDLTLNAMVEGETWMSKE